MWRRLVSGWRLALLALACELSHHPRSGTALRVRCPDAGGRALFLTDLACHHMPPSGHLTTHARVHPRSSRRRAVWAGMQLLLQTPAQAMMTTAARRRRCDFA